MSLIRRPRDTPSQPRSRINDAVKRAAAGIRSIPAGIPAPISVGISVGAATLAIAACGSSTGTPKETISASGTPQCAVTYHSTRSGTAVTITTTVPGKIDLAIAAIGKADERTVTAAQPGIVHVNFSETTLETLAATLKATSGDSFHCSIAPA